MFLKADISAQETIAPAIKWKIAAKLPAQNENKFALGLAGPVTGIHNDVLIVAGGANFPDGMPWKGGKKKYYHTVYAYQLKSGKLKLQHTSNDLPLSVAYAACVSTAQGIVYAGGENENGITDKVFLLQWDTKAKSFAAKELPSLPFAVTNAMATAIDNYVYVAGGEIAGLVSAQFLFLDLNNTAAGWQQLPALPKPVSNAVFVAQSNGDNATIYLIGGRKKNPGSTSDLSSSVFAFNVKTKSWEAKKSLSYALSAGTGIAYGKNYILLFGGDRGEAYNKTEKLIAAINAETDEMKKQQLVNEKNQLQENHPGFGKDVLLYNTETDEWTNLNQLPYDAPVTTTAMQWKDCVLLPSGEIKAGVRTPQILIGKINLGSPGAVHPLRQGRQVLVINEFSKGSDDECRTLTEASAVGLINRNSI